MNCHPEFSVLGLCFCASSSTMNAFHDEMFPTSDCCDLIVWKYDMVKIHYVPA